MRFLIFLIAVVFLSRPFSGATQEKPNRLNLGYSSISGSQAILRVTKDAGIFQKNGLDVSMVLIAGGSGIIQALVAGDLPVAIVSGEPAILARLQGADTVMLGGLINIIDFTIITATEVKKPSDLKGKKLAVSRFGSSTDFVVRYALEKWDSLPIAMLRFSNSAANLRAGGSQKRCRTRNYRRASCRHRSA